MLVSSDMTWIPRRGIVESESRAEMWIISFRVVHGMCVVPLNPAVLASGLPVTSDGHSVSTGLLPKFTSVLPSCSVVMFGSYALIMSLTEQGRLFVS